MKKKIAIIGAGAAGMLCAVTAASENNEITIFEKNSKAGRKILATGNGRCNITNRHVGVEHFHGHHPSFVTHAIRQFNSREAISFFQDLGLELTMIEDGRMFPASLQASSVVDFLTYSCLKKGVQFRFGHEVTEIKKEANLFLVSDSEGNREHFDRVVLASGSAAMPTLGSSDSGYSLARILGHHIYPQFATLVQLISQDPICKIASGVKIDSVVQAVVNRNSEAQVRGDLLFTSYGLSGLAILDISRALSHGLAKGYTCSVVVDLMPDISLSALKKDLQKRAKRFADYPPQLWLNGILHKKLVKLLFTKLKLSEHDKLEGKKLQSLAYMIKNLEISISDTRGPKGAEVMAGGIDTEEIDPKTMESKLCKGLYLCGEIVDIDGDRGGYNLHWAWASGHLAGKQLAL